MDFPIQYYLQQEQEAIEKEALIQLEIRRQKYTSDEAIKRSRLAVQRRVAAKADLSNDVREVVTRALAE